MNRKDEIKAAYRGLGSMHGFYDGMMLGTTGIGRFVLKHVWRMTREDALEYQAMAFAAIPEDFAGRLLEVPVGTGVLSLPVFKTMPKADITCLDYSERMMQTAKKRAGEKGIRNVCFRQGDVGSLPYDDEAFDVVMSLNGFHAFPDKEAAYRETFRVLKPAGTFCGCFYVQGGCARTDWFIRHLYQPKGFFTPPYETETSLRQRLSGLYSEVSVTRVEGIGCFRCVK